MKTLTLIRHAKSDWAIEWQSDFDRWLAEKWERQIKKMWKLLKKLEPNFDLIICSPAQRAVLTLNGLSKVYKNLKKMPTTFVDEIYSLHNSTWEGIIELIKKQNNKIDSLAIVGHNPLLSELVKRFTKIPLALPTLGIIQIEFDWNSWEDITKEGRIVWFLGGRK
jgi:phosphohistidine phosphatase